MRASFQQLWSLLTAMLLLFMSVQPSTAATDDHVVPLSDLQRQLRFTAEQRTDNLADVGRVLSHPAAVNELAKYGITPRQAREAVANLTDTELARLADRARAAEKDLQGGLIVGLLALIGLIVVIVVVLSILSTSAPQPAADTCASSRHGGVEGWAPTMQVAPVHG
ncbi:MAG: PA2779 family protein [Acidobacteria bacterium]|nr:PA2779 family protein [Acidobacteriota bacterium]MBI3280865.1 PA2779 family protein [Acidobacteriota bacterium]